MVPEAFDVMLWCGCGVYCKPLYCDKLLTHCVQGKMELQTYGKTDNGNVISIQCDATEP